MPAWPSGGGGGDGTIHTDAPLSGDGSVADPATIDPGALSPSYITGLAPVATSGSATDLSTGTLAAIRLPALTGNVTSSAGSAATTLAAGSASVLNSGTLPAARLPALTGDVTTSAGSATTALNASNAATMRSTLGLGTLATQSGTFSGTSSGTNTGDQTITLTGDVTGSGTGSFAASLAAGSASVLNSGTLGAARLPALTGDVTSSAGSAATTLAAGSATSLNSGTLAAARLPAMTGDVTATAGTHATTLAAGNIANLNSGNISPSRLQTWNTVAVANSAAQDLATGATMAGDGVDYEFSAMILQPNATNKYTFQINSVATNQSADFFGVSGGTGAILSTDTTLFIESFTSPGHTGTIYVTNGRITQMAGIERIITYDMTYFPASGNKETIHVEARWNVTTVVTAFSIHASTATGLGIGTTLRLRQISP